MVPLYSAWNAHLLPEEGGFAARPDGSMEVVKLYWFDHNCKDGQYSSAQVHRSVQVERREGVACPSGAEDYCITLAPLEGLAPEIIDGL